MNKIDLLVEATVRALKNLVWAFGLYVLVGFAGAIGIAKAFVKRGGTTDALLDDPVTVAYLEGLDISYFITTCISYFLITVFQIIRMYIMYIKNRKEQA